MTAPEANPLFRPSTIALTAVLALTLLAPAAVAHPIHTGCNPPQIWADAYLQQLFGPVHITYDRYFGLVDLPSVHFDNPGEIDSGIVCIPDTEDITDHPALQLIIGSD